MLRSALESVMERVLKSFILSIVFLFAANLASAQKQTLDNVRIAIKNGNTVALTSYLSSSIDLKINNDDGVYSDKQAIVVLEKFFTQAPASNFTYNHVGSTQSNSKYYSIGTYTTSTASYRVLISYKLNNGNYLIDKIHFDLE
jgi:hypothetical protein